MPRYKRAPATEKLSLQAVVRPNETTIARSAPTRLFRRTGGYFHAMRASTSPSSFPAAENAAAVLDVMRTNGRIGLVLAAGGLTGIAHHVGNLLALERVTGWDARSAAVIVGTSAGSITGSLIRRGLNASDLYAFGSGDLERISSFGRGFLESAFNTDRSVSRLPSFRVPTVFELPRLLRLANQGSASFLMLGFLGSGSYDVLSLVRSLGDGWPMDPLLVPAVRRSDGKRVVFDGGGGVDLHRAVAASCAVPGFMQDVDVDGGRFVDGGVSSASNVDLLCTYDLDAVVIVSPMTGDRAGSIPGAMARRRAQGKLEGERSLITDIPVMTLEPRGPLSAQILDEALWSGELSSIAAGSLDQATQVIASTERQDVFV